MNLPTLYRCFVTYSFPRGAKLPHFKGSTLRGAFGQALHRIVCRIPHQDCATCLNVDNCLYVRLFEPRIPPRYASLKLGQQAPLPYVFKVALSSRTVFAPRDPFTFELILIGRVVADLPLIVYCLESMALDGLGFRRAPAVLLEIAIDQGDLSVVPLYRRGDERMRLGADLLQPLRFANLSPGILDEQIEEIRLRFLTPLRVQYRGVLQKRLDFPTFIATLFRRLSFLTLVYDDKDSGFDLPVLIELAKRVQVIEDGLIWQELNRYSNRQHEKIDISGLVGTISFAGELWPFLPFLGIGEFLHLGKSCSFGLGEYRIEVPAELYAPHPLPYHYNNDSWPILTTWNPREALPILPPWPDASPL